MTELFTDAKFKGIDPEDLKKGAEAITGKADTVELVEGDVTTTCLEVSPS